MTPPADESVVLWGVKSTEPDRVVDSAYPREIMAKCQACNYGDKEREVVQLRCRPLALDDAMLARVARLEALLVECNDARVQLIKILEPLHAHARIDPNGLGARIDAALKETT